MDDKILIGSVWRLGTSIGDCITVEAKWEPAELELTTEPVKIVGVLDAPGTLGCRMID
jgi:hypothetical protein